ncbi:hypothetical protein EES41_38140 (plasmid) [Streptomyces sp. ADI95-16]|nr:hypothetical protein EES41_38140 [Streptomyces sp. ADI95-16]
MVVSQPPHPTRSGVWWVVVCPPGAGGRAAHERLGGQLAAPEGSLALTDVIPPPVHLHAVVDALAANPALPPELVRRPFAYR